MRRFARFGSEIGLLVVLALVALPSSTSADIVCNHLHECVINNGLAPPNAENVIDNYTYRSDTLYVRNVGCPPGWPSGEPWAPCPAPGGPTEIEIVDGAAVLYLSARGSSIVAMSGGTVVDRLEAGDFSIVTLSGGTVGTYLSALDSATVTMNGGTVLWGSLVVVGDDPMHPSGHSPTLTMSGGTVRGRLVAGPSGTITMVGGDFEVDGVSVPYGDLTAQVGWLTGILASGDPVNNQFYQGHFFYSGTVCLEDPGTEEQECPVPEPSSALLVACALATLALLRRRAVGAHGKDTTCERF